MTNPWQTIGEQGLRFFGTMTASISHEIKNALAVINENAGLLEDLTVLAQKGKPLDMERVKTQAHKIMKQVQRADGIVRNMNRFAHSTDETRQQVDPGELLALMGDISQRLATMRGITVEVKASSEKLAVTTNPFLLLTLIWHCLDFAMQVAGGAKRVGLRAEKTGPQVQIKFNGLEGLNENITGFPDEKETALAEILQGKITLDQANKELVLLLA